MRFPQHSRTVVPGPGAQISVVVRHVLDPGDAGLHRRQKLHVRDRHLFRRKSEGPEETDGLREDLSDLIEHQVVKVAPDEPNLQSADVIPDAFRIVRHGHVRAEPIPGVIPRDAAQDQGTILHRLGQDPKVIDRAGSRACDPAKQADSPVCRLQSGDAAERRGIPHRAGAVGADGGQAQARRHRRGRTAARSAGGPGHVPGIAAGTVEHVVGMARLGPLVHMGLAQDHRARGPEFPHHRLHHGRASSRKVSSTPRWSGRL